MAECLGFQQLILSFLDADLIVPAKGVYAARVVISDIEHLGMANIGYNPTFGDIDKKTLRDQYF